VTGPQWFLFVCFLVFAAASLYRISQAFPRGAGSLASSRGKGAPAVLYSLTKAMLPWKKETAQRHLPSYVLGIGYHVGVFLGFVWLTLIFFDATLPPGTQTAAVVLLALAALCGLALLMKRIATPRMRYLSNPDDYFSNVLVTGFLTMTAAALLYRGVTSWYFVYAGVVLLYIPVGKLRHAIYFGLARVYLGLFYGRRGVWPAGDRKSWRA
jgi:nitrate reductase gamma subunit